jgi:lysozyme
MLRKVHAMPERPIDLNQLPGGAARLIRLVLTTAASLALASCALERGYYPAKSDAKPHPKVARAQDLPIHGIDVSKWQGKIDWASVKAAGTQFAFIKATEGGDHVDERFSENWHGARQAGVPRGAYHFVYWCRPAHEQAAWFKRNVPADPDALPPVLDLEWNGHSPTCPKKLDKETALEKIRLMLNEMEAHTGKRPIIYTDITFHKDVLEGELEEYPHWVRSVAAEPHERYVNRDWILWQYTTTGRVPGIKGDVDRNAFYGGSSEWAKFLATDCDPRQYASLSSIGACNGK